MVQASATGKVQTVSEKAAADESYEKRQMLWKGMVGRSWTEPDGAGATVGSAGGGVSPAAELDCSIDEGDWTSVGRQVCTGRSQLGWGGRVTEGAARGA